MGEFDENYEIKCARCNEISETIINSKTDKPYTICENCRSICGKRGGRKIKINKKEDKGQNEWKHIIFGSKQDGKTTNSAIYNISENDIETDNENSEKSVNDDEQNEKSNVYVVSNGELIAGRVENVDNIKKDLTTLSLNDKVDYIIDLLTKNIATNDNSINDENNDKIYDVIYDGFNKVVARLTTLTESINKTNNDIQRMKIAII